MAARTFYDLRSILKNGGGLDMDKGNLSAGELLDLARSMSPDSTLTLRGLSSVSSSDLLSITRQAKGRVVFAL